MPRGKNSLYSNTSAGESTATVNCNFSLDTSDSSPPSSAGSVRNAEVTGKESEGDESQLESPIESIHPEKWSPGCHQSVSQGMTSPDASPEVGVNDQPIGSVQVALAQFKRQLEEWQSTRNLDETDVKIPGRSRHRSPEEYHSYDDTKHTWQAMGSILEETCVEAGSETACDKKSERSLSLTTPEPAPVPRKDASTSSVTVSVPDAPGDETDGNSLSNGERPEYPTHEDLPNMMTGCIDANLAARSQGLDGNNRPHRLASTEKIEVPQRTSQEALTLDDFSELEHWWNSPDIRKSPQVPGWMPDWALTVNGLTRHDEESDEGSQSNTECVSVKRKSAAMSFDLDRISLISNGTARMVDIGPPPRSFAGEDHLQRPYNILAQLQIRKVVEFSVENEPRKSGIVSRTGEFPAPANEPARRSRWLGFKSGRPSRGSRRRGDGNSGYSWFRDLARSVSSSVSTRFSRSTVGTTTTTKSSDAPGDHRSATITSCRFVPEEGSRHLDAKCESANARESDDEKKQNLPSKLLGRFLRKVKGKTAHAKKTARATPRHHRQQPALSSLENGLGQQKKQEVAAEDFSPGTLRKRRVEGSMITP
ncbi:hypothetical protein QFC21_003295 [Naganishia friedmannii]|uniref:Uncharacterized protein n=1 Tax=Naganishia friedmannii TaxID=89922 RepID=A0ACC2VP53_9TREE|nr:hypothetical protein QFC21_003295 [Naganishia friedmannii]